MNNRNNDNFNYYIAVSNWPTKRARWAHLALSVGVEFQKQLKTVKMKKTYTTLVGLLC